MNLLKTDTTIVKKSKFIAYLYDLSDLSEVKTILNELRLEHKKAKHVVYAYKYGNTAGKNDDKEPLNSAGLPLYNLLEMRNINNKLIVVVRYFGGTKLGVGPLTRAYKNAGINVLD